MTETAAPIARLKVDLHERTAMEGSFITTVEIFGERKQGHGLPDMVVWKGRFFRKHSLVGMNKRPIYDECTAVAAIEDPE